MQPRRYGHGCPHAAVLFVFAGAVAGAQQAANELADPSFEQAAEGTVSGWSNYARGYTVDRDVVHDGKQSLRCTSRDEQDGMGVVQVIRYEKPDKRPIIIGGWSKAQDVGGGGDYSIYLDIFYEDGTPWWGKTATWRRGTHDWEYTAQVYWPTKPVKEIQAFVFLRRTTGTAWFDDVFLCRGGLHLVGFQVASDSPRTTDGLRLKASLTAEAKWTCSLLSEAGEEIDSLQGEGKEIVWQRTGRRGESPTRARIEARTEAGETLESERELRLPPRLKNPVAQGYAVWTRDSMEKVYPGEFPAADDRPEASLALARNEHEGVQLAITPADSMSLEDVCLDIGRFTSDEGAQFPADQIQWHVVGYVWVETPSSHPDAPREPNWCPDALLPAKPFDVPGGRTQTLWLDFHATEDTKPGTYRGNVTVRPANASATEVALTVRVHNFALPKSPRMKTAFAIMDGFTRKTYGELTPELRRKCLDVMLDHRLNPDDISRTEPPRIEDLLYARDRGMNAFNILNLVPKPEGNPLWVCYVSRDAYGPDFNQQLAARLDDYVAELRKHGLSKMGYVYGFDERREDYDELIKGICKFIKERYPEVSTFTTATYMYHKRKDTPPGYQDYVDWYCPLSSGYDPALSAKLRAEGKQVWWYVCCGPQHPFANFSSMDYPSIEGRLLSWMTYGFEADGLLFWHVNYWGQNKIIEGDDPYLDWKPTCIARMTGDGQLTYPGPDGPLSSIRLENVRDGIEDYDYLCLLENAAGREEAAKHFSRLVKSMREYTRDPEELYRVRVEMADVIDASL